MSSVPRLPPQLPPLSPQPSLPSPTWPVHHRREEGGISVSLPTSSSGNGSGSPPPRALPDPFEKLPVTNPSLLPPPGSGLSSSGLDSSSVGRSRSYSRSRVPLPILPSASSSEPIVISPPNRAHSRSISNGTPPRQPPPTSRPNTVGKVYGLPPRPSPVDKDASRPLPRVPKHTPPQLPIPDPGSMSKQSRPGLPPRKSSLSSDSSPLMQPPTPFTPHSAPPLRAPLKCHNLEASQMKRGAVPTAVPSSVPSPVPSPISAPVEKTKERELIEERLRQKRNERAKFIALRRDQPFILGLLTESHDAENDEPDTSPDLPPERTSTPLTMPSPTLPSIVRPDSQSSSSRTPSPPPFAYSSISRSRHSEVAMTVRPPPGLLGVATERATSPQREANGTGYSRKWVLEKKGKRLTQDTIVAAQQLRMLR